MPSSMTPAEVSLRAKLAAHSRWAKEDPNHPDAAPARARAGFWQKFLDEVDPDRVLPEDERIRRAESARKAHMYRLSLMAARAKRARREAETKQRKAESELRQLREEASV